MISPGERERELNLRNWQKGAFAVTEMNLRTVTYYRSK
jgi:hypothetical protein